MNCVNADDVPERLQSIKDHPSFARRRTCQCSDQGLRDQVRCFFLHEIANRLGHHNDAEPAIGFVDPPLYHSASYKPVHNSGHRTVRQANAVAKLFQAHSIGVKHDLHDTSLWPRELTTCEFRLQGTPQLLAYLADISLNGFRHFRQSLDSILRHVGQSQNEWNYRTPYGLLIR